MFVRGNVYWVELDPTKGSEIKKLRPCVIVSNTQINMHRHTVIVIPLSTSAKERRPIIIAVNYGDRQSVAICDQIRTVDKSRLKRQDGRISSADLEALEDSLRKVLSL